MMTRSAKLSAFWSIAFIFAITDPWCGDLGAQEAKQKEVVSSAGAALRSIFSPVAAPERKTMGLLQRSFLDLADSTNQRKVELALVIDGTDSMSADIDGVKQSARAMIDDLKRHCRDISVAIVVYRDSASPSGPTSILVDRFSKEVDSIHQVLQGFQPESGAPFFHELPDAGLSAAIDKLNWSDEVDTSRWIFLIGDAPPYAESFNDPKVPQAKRAHATDALIARAAVKGIQIHCLLCKSSESLAPVYQSAISETRAFMTAVSEGTGGMMLDLSYPEVSKALLEAGAKPTVEYIEIQPITEAELVKVSQTIVTSTSEPVLKEARIAVLPHMPLDELSFDPKNQAVQVSASLRHKFQNLPGIRVTSPYDVERQYRRLRSENLSEEHLIRALAARLSVDYVVWGDSSRDGLSAIYSGATGEKTAVASLNDDENGIRLASTFLTSKSSDRKLVALQKTLRPEDLAKCSQRLAADPLVEREILAALESLQQAIGYLAGAAEADNLLQLARQSCDSALKSDDKNALVYWLSANTAFNMAQACISRGDNDGAKTHMRTVVQHLGRAIQTRNAENIDSPSLLKEILADYELLARGNLSRAIQMYESIANDESLCSSVRRRAHWMLIGIYSGDWKAGTNFRDESAFDPNIAPAKIRQHAINILAAWPESPEAKLLKQWLRWNSETNGSTFNYVPKSNDALGNIASIGF